MDLRLSIDAKNIIDVLHNNGYECFAVGGCVRDLILGIEPKDYDFTTNAEPDDILKCFSEYKTFEVGKKYGTISVLLNDNTYEITTYRTDGVYEDGRHPEDVKFTKSLEEDLKRRDFTINALAFNQYDGLVDYFNGVNDINSKIIKCVGNANERMCEDKLRVLRALRFSSVLSFDIEDGTKEAILTYYKDLDEVSIERINVELTKLLCGENVYNVLNEYKEVLFKIIPELKVTDEFNQLSPHHCYTLYDHIIRTVSLVENEPLLRVTMLLHDIGKPSAQTFDSNNRAHYKKHPIESSIMCGPILKRLCYSNEFVKDVSSLIMYHDVRFNGDKKKLKYVLKEIGPKLTNDLIRIQKADMLAQSFYKRDDKEQHHHDTLLAFESILINNECYNLKMLQLNGDDLIKENITDGKEIGNILGDCLIMVIEERLCNDHDELLQYAINRHKYLTK